MLNLGLFDGRSLQSLRTLLAESKKYGLDRDELLNEIESHLEVRMHTGKTSRSCPGCSRTMSTCCAVKELKRLVCKCGYSEVVK